ncbi:sugar kinase [Consotaella salsifontis]|uniref:2-keto-3-deoxygluconate kinase n=1 Tax=Consotaella salsifontis TaxID=1365950 RepID=A0A1T4T2C1_9HYPH|nr:sugar kinase [Consotaella salsifontis]SKA34596.1 2-keto-3-deoxygluconate kinase [Consotaella salsifontis]
MVDHVNEPADGGAAPQGRILAIGECMVELSSAPEGLLRMGFAGDTFNTSWYLRRALPASWQVSYFSAVGDDPVSSDLLAFMREGGIDTSLVRRIPGRMPGLYLIRLNEGERSFYYWRDTSAAKLLADDRDVLRAAIEASSACYFSGITMAILSPEARATLLDELRQARDAGKPVIFDPNLRPRLWPSNEVMCQAIEAAAAVSTMCLPSYSDDEVAFRDASPEATAQRYRALGVAEVVVKDGPEPAYFATSEEFVSVPATKIEKVVDTTAAGDSFNAAYIAARLTGASGVEAVKAGHAMAGEVVGHYGALIRS